MIKDPTTTLEFLENLCREAIDHVFKKKLSFIQVDEFEFGYESVPYNGVSHLNTSEYKYLMVSCIFNTFDAGDSEKVHIPMATYKYYKKFIFKKTEGEYELVSMLDRKE